MTRRRAQGRRVPTVSDPDHGIRRDDLVQLGVAASVYSIPTLLAYRRPVLGRRAMGLSSASWGQP